MSARPPPRRTSRPSVPLTTRAVRVGASDCDHAAPASASIAAASANAAPASRLSARELTIRLEPSALAAAEDELRVVGHPLRGPRRIPCEPDVDVLAAGHRPPYPAAG